jgi:hypothetical protein
LAPFGRNPERGQLLAGVQNRRNARDPQDLLEHLESTRIAALAPGR